MGDFPANGQPDKANKNVHTHGPVPFFVYFPKTATCGEGFYMHATCTEYSSQCIILQHQVKLPSQRFSQPQQTLEQTQLIVSDHKLCNPNDCSDDCIQ